MKIVVCDDEPKILNDIADKISEIFCNIKIPADIYKTDRPEYLIEYLEKNKTDILFLDIDMPKISGMDIAQTILNQKINTLLIFVTNQEALVYKSFRYHPFSFIRKSRFESEITEVVLNAVQKINSMQDMFTFKSNNELCRIKISHIVYFESDANYVKLFTVNETYRFRNTLSALESSLSQKGFIRIHKGFLVNQSFVYSIKADEIVLSNNTRLPIGRTNKENVKKQLMRYMR